MAFFTLLLNHIDLFCESRHLFGTLKMMWHLFTSHLQCTWSHLSETCELICALIYLSW